ncbi:MAG: hypothetical protein OEW24_08535 [Chloroflexota bacterium]|nr:hypothetical protein [Chloroflexota bacterium]
MSTHERIYRRLLRLFPAAFRARYAEPMAQLFADQLRDAREAGAPAGSLRLWARTAGDLLTSALSQHLERDRTVAHSAATVPSFSARALGIAGVLAGLVLIVPAVIAIDDVWYPPRIMLFNALVIALAVGLHRRQAAASPRLASVASALVILANGWYLGMVMLGVGDVNLFGTAIGSVMLFSGLFLWGAAAAYGAASLAIGAFSRWGAVLLVIGSLVGITGLDRFGLTHGDFGAFFDTAAQVGIALHGVGWILLGAELALRASPRGEPTASA